jgi:hypothetical protein
MSSHPLEQMSTSLFSSARSPGSSDNLAKPTNYSSANTFLDAFVDYRTLLGLLFSAINLGSVHKIAFVAENEETLRKFTAMGLHRILEQALLMH